MPLRSASFVPFVALLSSVAFACADDGAGDDEIGDSSGTSDSGTSDSGTSDTDTSATDTSDTDTSDTGGVPCEEDPDQATIHTTYGPVTGGASEVEGVRRFLNIPYAEPPIGLLRFAAPEPPTPWQEPRDATEFGPRCIQLAVSGDDPSTVGSEDCLQLNVWTPDACEGADHPVMVFIHGGGNAVGSAVDPLYDGAILAGAQEAVVVTLNYRLGALGWFAATEHGIPGNNGLRDQILALEWVRDNIDRFGGDPDRVMIFGESAGAVNTCALVGAPAAAGLFSAAIVQSGTCRQQPFADLEAMSQELKTSLGCTGDEAPACLLSVAAEDMVFAAPNGYPSVAGLGQGWGPCVDGELLPKTTLEALSAGEVDVPFVVGSNRDETFQDTPPNLTAADYQTLVTVSFGFLANQVLAAYPVDDYPTPSAAWASLTTDLKFVCSARKAAVASAQGGAPTWRYQFSFDDYTTLPNTPRYAFHGLELVYLFGNFSAIFGGGFDYQPNAGELELSLAMQQAWSEVAAGAGFPGPSYEIGVDPYRDIDVPNGEGAGLRTAQCDFWDQWL